MDADFDFDVIDHAEDDEDDEEEAAQAPRGASGGHRGPDIQWNENEFKNSEEYGLLKEFNKKKSWRSDYADSETSACKHARKAHFRKCPRLLKLEYLGASKTVVMLDNSQEHNHAMDANYGDGKKYCWTPVQEGIVLPLARSRATATVVDRELRRQGAVDSQEELCLQDPGDEGLRHDGHRRPSHGHRGEVSRARGPLPGLHLLLYHR